MKKMKLLIPIAMLGLFGSFAFTMESPMPVLADAAEENTSVVSESAEDASGDEAASAGTAASEDEGGAIKEAYNKVYGWINEKIVPLLGGATLASVLSAIVAVASAILKHRGDVKSKTLIEGQNEKVELLKALVEVLKSNEDEMYKTYNEVFEKLSATTEVTANQSKAIAELVAEQNSKIAQVEKMKDSIEVACDLIAKSLALSETAVRSGVAQDAKKLIENLKSRR